jgi:predicted DNA repair protein MutK
MASGFFALLDDIAAVMDDVAMMSKITTKKTAGILGDDLAVNAEKASGFVSSRELPVLWAITKGSMLNKLIILPLAFLLSAFLPMAIPIILMVGGVYLAYEGAEKVYEYLVPHPHASKADDKENQTEAELLAIEKAKIKSAIITDFILSVEIVIIALGTVIDQSMTIQIIVVSLVAFIATIGVYGIVALIVRMDDFGYRLIRMTAEDNSISDIIGRFFVKALPLVIKGLAVVGTIALLLVAGGIFVHQLEFLHHFLERWPSFIKDFGVGLVVGFVALLMVKGLKKGIALIGRK